MLDSGTFLFPSGPVFPANCHRVEKGLLTCPPHSCLLILVAMMPSAVDHQVSHSVNCGNRCGTWVIDSGTELG